MPKHILVIEDQKDINDLIALNLKTLNFIITQCHDGKKGFELASQGQFDAIVLDIMLPSIDGLQICQSLRARGCRTPILMLTAKKSESERVIGLEMGADDYLTKPFSVLELQARVKALLRRSEFNNQDDTKTTSVITSGQLTIDTGKRLVSYRDHQITLTAKEFDLLFHLASHPGQVFSRDQLLDSVWGYQHSGYEHTVNSHINRLRSKLESKDDIPQLIHTVWGVGYKYENSQVET